MMLSKVERAPQMTLGDDRLSVTSHKGYRTVRCSQTSDVRRAGQLVVEG